MMRYVMAIGAGLWGALASSLPAMSQPRSVGTAVSIVREVVQTAVPGRAGDQLRSGDAIIHGYQLATGQASRGEFELEDETRLVLNENSALVIDDLVVGSGGAFSRISLNALSGAFRFISGDSPSEAYEISAGVTTLGIRGTAFDVYVGRGDTAAVMLLSGRVRVCRSDAACEELTRRCEIAVSSPSDQLVEKLAPGMASVADVPISAAFPFAADQSVLGEPFRVRGAESCVRRAALIQRREAEQVRTTLVLQGDEPAVADPGVAANEPAGPGLNGNPGTSGRTPGVSRSISSSASERARSDPGRSASSSAGGRKSGQSSASGGDGKANGKGKGKGRG
jgi:hypothetical protein